MDPLIVGGLVAGGLNLAGDLVSQTNARSAFKTRYQDTVKDMQKAGLNPALAYGQGGGNPQTHPIGDVGSSATQAAQGAAAMRLTNAQAKLLEAQTEDLILTTRANRYLANFRQQNEDTKGNIMALNETRMRDLNPEYYAKYRAQSAKAQADAEGARLGLPERRAYSDYYSSWYGKNEPYMQSARDWAKSATDIVRAARKNNPPDYDERTVSGKGYKSTSRRYQRRP